jgi:hypothetical protein
VYRQITISISDNTITIVTKEMKLEEDSSDLPPIF